MLLYLEYCINCVFMIVVETAGEVKLVIFSVNNRPTRVENVKLCTVWRDYQSVYYSWASPVLNSSVNMKTGLIRKYEQLVSNNITKHICICTISSIFT